MLCVLFLIFDYVYSHITHIIPSRLQLQCTESKDKTHPEAEPTRSHVLSLLPNSLFFSFLNGGKGDGGLASQVCCKE